MNKQIRYIWLLSFLFLNCTHTISKNESYNTTPFPTETADYVKNWDERKLAEATSYKIIGSCGGLPKINLKTAPGFCVGLVDNGENMIFPRTAVEINQGQMLVVDMGGWATSRGRIYLLSFKNGQYIRTTLLDGAKSNNLQVKKMLDRPHLIQKGPDGLFYLGSASQITRFDPNKISSEIFEVIIDNIPSLGLHPLKAFTFDSAGNLYVNVGSATNVCQKQGVFGLKNSSCSEVEDTQQGQAQIRKYTRLPNGKYAPQFQIYARGLRNSMGLLWHNEKNLLIQAENGRDAINTYSTQISNLNLPHEELNIVKNNSHYGWPYCYDNNLNNPEWTNINCDNYQKPYLLLPAHASPLSILRYKGNLFPTWYKNRFIFSLHGYQPLGHRIVTFKHNDEGLPTGHPLSIVYGWDQNGEQPLGSPVGITELSDGSLVIVEDKNKKVLRLFYESTVESPLPIDETPETAGTDTSTTNESLKLKSQLETVLASPNPPIFAKIQNQMIDKHCTACHAGTAARGLELKPYDYFQNEKRIIDNNKARQILSHISGNTSYAPMPPDGFKTEDEKKSLIDLYIKWLTEKGL